MLWIPSIHRLPRRKGESFHKLAEVIEAVQSRRDSTWRLRELIRHGFIHLTLKGRRRASEGNVSSLKLYNEYSGQRVVSSEHEDMDLDTLPTLEPTIFVSAGWGMKVLSALDQGVVSVSLVHWGRNLIEIGTGSEGTQFQIKQ